MPLLRPLRRNRPSSGIATTLLLCLLAGGASSLAAQTDEAAATRLLHEADRLRAAGDAAAALGEYDALLKRFPQSTLAPRAVASMASIHFAAGDLEAATAAAARLVEAYPDSGESAAALVMQARILERQARSVAELEEALTLLKRVPNVYGAGRYPILLPRAEARVFAGELLIQLDQLGEAAAAFVEVIEDEPRGPYTLTAQIGLGRVLAYRGDRVAAMEAFQEAINEGLRNEDAASQAAVADARRRLTLLYRHWVRPATGTAPWTATEPLSVAAGWKKPQGVAAAADGTIVVADANLGVVRIGADRSASTLATRDAERPFTNASGGFHVPADGTVRSVEGGPSRSFQTRGERPRSLDKIRAGARGLLGEWYLVDRGTDGVQVFADDGAQQATLSGELEAVDVAVDERGSVYVLSEKPTRVTVHDLDRDSVDVVSGAWRKPVALAVDWLGQIYVLDGATGAVSVLDHSGRTVTTLVAPPGGPELRSPEDLAVDRSGAIVLADPRASVVLRVH